MLRFLLTRLTLVVPTFIGMTLLAFFLIRDGEGLARRIRRAYRPVSIAIHSAFGTQVLLGIATVMSGMALPLAAAHQLVGALTLAAAAWGAHALGRGSV